MSEVDKNSNSNKESSGFANFFKTIGHWFKRMFCGASKDLKKANVFDVEKIESPAKMAVKTFFRRKLAVVALVVLISLFLFVFIGPAIFPMDVNFVDIDQQNISPGMSMRSVPSELKNDIRTISSYGTFSVGVSNDNTLYIWGIAKNNLTNINYKDMPEEIQPGSVYTAAAGTDHVVAVVINKDDPTKGHLVIWGDKNRGQYGYNTGNSEDKMIELPKEILNGDLELSKIGQLNAGKQVSALVYDGKAYLWGSQYSCLNLERLYTRANETDKRVAKVVFTNYFGLILCEDGSLISPGDVAVNYFRDEDGFSMMKQDEVDMISFISNNKIVDIAASKNCFALLSESGDVVVQGASQYSEKLVPPVGENEKVTAIHSGAFHFAALTDANKVYLWGSNLKKQCDLNGAGASDVFTGPYQTYLLDGEGKLTDSCGLKGYLFGTDNLGRDTFTRIIHGGRMTMTIGAVAVIISSIIAIIIGCLSGYFGGWVDMLLMRVTEIFSAIPFLPFAMMLSYIMVQMPLSENTRIFIIMCILGLLSWTGLAHMIRGQVLAEREKEFVLAAKAMGVKEGRIAFKHILPNVISVILVSMTLDFAGCLLTESSLSYLGFGVQQPRPTWGNMLNGANNAIVIQNYWWQWVFPAIFLGIATISINIIGDTLRDVLDPKSSREK